MQRLTDGRWASKTPGTTMDRSSSGSRFYSPNLVEGRFSFRKVKREAKVQSSYHPCNLHVMV